MEQFEIDSRGLWDYIRGMNTNLPMLDQICNRCWGLDVRTVNAIAHYSNYFKVHQTIDLTQVGGNTAILEKDTSFNIG